MSVFGLHSIVILLRFAQGMCNVSVAKMVKLSSLIKGAKAEKKEKNNKMIIMTIKK